MAYLTQEGYEKYKAELEVLKTERRAEVAERIKIARGFGDLSENAEYDEAKNEQAVVESRILDLENLLRTAQIVEETGDKEVCHVGCKVKLYDETFKEEVVYTIVGSAEANPIKGKISNESPVGSAILGCRVGDSVEVMTPGGVNVFKVLEIL